MKKEDFLYLKKKYKLNIVQLLTAWRMLYCPESVSTYFSEHLGLLKHLKRYKAISPEWNETDLDYIPYTEEFITDMQLLGNTK